MYDESLSEQHLWQTVSGKLVDAQNGKHPNSGKRKCSEKMQFYWRIKLSFGNEFFFEQNLAQD